MADSTQTMLTLERLMPEGIEMVPHPVPPEWCTFLRPNGSPLAGAWTTPEGYTVALCRLQIIAVIRPGGSAPAAYLRTPDEVLSFIAVDACVHHGVFTRAELQKGMEVPA